MAEKRKNALFMCETKPFLTEVSLQGEQQGQVLSASSEGAVEYQ